MKRILLFASILVISNLALAQNAHKSDSTAKEGMIYDFKFEGYPCDSLYNIKGLKNVTCDNYVCITHQDIIRLTAYVAKKINKKEHVTRVR